MRIPDDVRKCVGFIGFSDAPEKGGIACVGTFFLLGYEGYRYLVTAQHIAAGIGDAPFVIRLNKSDGTADLMTGDPVTDEAVKWYSHPDPNIDLAVMPFNYDLAQRGFDGLFINSRMVANNETLSVLDIGIGDVCYTVGLFKLLAGNKRNLPVVHTGNIALMPGDEKIPVRDWMAGHNSPAIRHVEGYLIETQSLPGLSGSPVFVRPGLDMNIPTSFGSKENITTRWARKDLYLLGIWQSSWDAPPDEVMAVERAKGVRVPIGMGVVVPAIRLTEILEQQELKDMRKQFMDEVALRAAATPDSVTVSRPETGATENPNGREDFTRLLGAAATPKKSGDQTSPGAKRGNSGGKKTR